MSKTFFKEWTQRQYEAVMAANPYGCNQYGEGWKKPHNGAFRQSKGESGGSTEGETQEEETQEEEPQEETSPEMEGSEKQKAWAEDILNKGVDDAVKAGGSFMGGELRRELKEKHGIDLAKLTREQAQAILDMLVDPQKKQFSKEKLKAIVNKWKGGKKAGDIINSGSPGRVIHSGNWHLPERDGEPIKPVATATAQAIADMLKQKSEHVSAKHCNQYYCPHKGTTREEKTKAEPKRVYRVDQSKPMHNQINALTDALERATKDGVRLEAVITRPEFGELIISCGHPGEKGKDGDSRGVGAQHVAEGRHKITLRNVAEALLKGKISPDKSKSRIRVTHNKVRVVLEKEIHQHSGRISTTRAKLHTAMHI